MQCKDPTTVCHVRVRGLAIHNHGRRYEMVLDVLALLHASSTKGAYDTFICADCGQGILRRNREKLGALCAGIHIYMI